MVLVPVDGSSHLDKQIDRAIAIPIPTSHPVAFLKVASSRGGGDIDEPFAREVSEHTIRDQCAKVRVSCPKIKIEQAVVVKVGKVRAHGDEDPFESGFLGDVDKSLAALVQIQATLGFGTLLADHPLDACPHRSRVVCCEDVLPSVVVKVPCPAGKAHLGTVDPQGARDVLESSVPTVAPQLGSNSRQVIDKQIGPTIVFDIDPSGSFANHPLASGHSSSGGYILEGPISFIAIQTIGLLLAAYKDIQPAIAIEIGPSRRDRIQRL